MCGALRAVPQHRALQPQLLLPPPPPCLPLHKLLLPQKKTMERPHRCISNRLTAAWILPGTSWSRQKWESRGRSSRTRLPLLQEEGAAAATAAAR